MWKTLRSDLKEFVSTVTDESTNVLEAIDTKMQQAEDAAAEADRGLDDGGAVMAEEDVATDFESTGLVSNAADEKLRRMSDEATFLEPLVLKQDDDKEFIETFDIDTKTQEIASLLELHEKLKAMFEKLVPTQVSYQDFWQRFFYRCNEERIDCEWQREEERAREARAKALQGGIESVKNLFGGAVQAVSHQFEKSEDEEQQGIGAAIFGTGGRPPFVMNTAVDEDDEEEEEEEEEEELGWDDDDDDDYIDEDEEEEESYTEGESEEQIEFGATHKEEIERLRQELAQAIEERDQLHQTVEMQSKAIADLQEQEGVQPPTSSDANNNNEELEKLKMSLFEKDAELAALKASLEDTHEDDKKESGKKDAAKIAAHERELERLTQELSTKNSEFVQLEEQLKTSLSELEQLRSQSQADNAVLDQLRSQSQADKTALFETQAAKSELESRIKTLEEAVAKSESDMGEKASQVAAAQEEAATAQEAVATLTAELQEAKGKLEFTSRRADHLDQELAAAKKELEQKGKEKSAPASPVSDSSSGVKVPPLDTPAVGAMDAVVDDEDDDDDDAWGDEWGSDDE